MHTKNVLSVSSSPHLRKSSIAVSEFQGAFNFRIPVRRLLMATETPYLGANSHSKGFVTAAKRSTLGGFPVLLVVIPLQCLPKD